jgi:hypothetical protein
MNDPRPAVVGAACVVLASLVVIFAVFAVRRERRRRDEMRRWAELDGWTFTLHPNVPWGRELPGGNKNGVGTMFSRVLNGRPSHVAQYSVTDASDGTTTNTHYYVVTVTLLNRMLPFTQVSARGCLSRLMTRRVQSGR